MEKEERNLELLAKDIIHRQRGIEDRLGELEKWRRRMDVTVEGRISELVDSIIAEKVKELFK